MDARAISIPKMKSGEPFDLPLSNHMVKLVSEALEQGDVLYPGSHDCSLPAGQIKATSTWRERTLPGETGHILRHTYRTIAQRAGIDKIHARLLLDHIVPGIDGVYIHENALFDRLLASQEQMSAAILALLRRKVRNEPFRAVSAR